MHMNYNKKRVGIVGARGYSGLDLARILLKHPGAQLTACFAGEKSFALSDYLPEAAAEQVPVVALTEIEQMGLDCVFLATPAEASLELAPRLSGKMNLIDLSGAYRLTAADYPRWYNFEHSSPALLEKAAYGLAPLSSPKGAKLLSNPGCFATSVLMALVPLLRTGLIDPTKITIDAKSGTSGAGRKAAENLLFTEVDGNCLPYRVGKHQHLPEIIRYAKALGGVDIDPHFVTSLLPVRRGIISGIYADLRDGVTVEDVTEAFESAYAGYSLVKFGPIQGAKGLSLRQVVGSARTHIRYEVVGEKLYLFSLIDNLLKGAASQAVENFNRLYDFPVDLALEDMEGVL
jgi:N-acetyl-gamma-glutamyl-phosphate reductase